MKLLDFPSDINKNLAKSLQIIEDQVLLVSETTQSASLRKVLNSALDWIRPQPRYLGLRTSLLTNEKIEMVLPEIAKLRSQNLKLDDSILIAAGTECFRSLWKRHATSDQFKIEIGEVHWRLIKNPEGAVKIRWQLKPISREAVLSELLKLKEAKTEATVLYYDETNQIVCEMKLTAVVTDQSRLQINNSI